jgi:hypothetical protein
MFLAPKETRHLMLTAPVAPPVELEVLIDAVPAKIGPCTYYPHARIPEYLRIRVAGMLNFVLIGSDRTP